MKIFRLLFLLVAVSVLTNDLIAQEGYVPTKENLENRQWDVRALGCL